MCAVMCDVVQNSTEDDQQLSDVERVARGIVDVNIFITSQVSSSLCSLHSSCREQDNYN